MHRRSASAEEHGPFGRSFFVLVLLFCAGAPPVAGQQLPASTARGLTSGEAIYNAGCAGCHGARGAGAAQSTVGFTKPSTFPDFTSCAGTTPELDVDWKATITEGGHGRGFSPIMPSFSDELTSAQIDAVIHYLRGQCHDQRWARGELNLPRPLRTEKAFPESETTMTMGATTHHAPDWSGEITYERQLAARDQLEVAIPFSSIRGPSDGRATGVGDAAFGWKHVLFASHTTIVSGQGEVVLPTGNSERGLGAGVTTLGVFAAAGQILPNDSFVQVQVGTDQPTSTDIAPRTFYWRVAAGRSWREESGLGRLWSPMLEVVSARDVAEGARANIDLVPQFQVTLNRREHIRVAVGVQVPATNTAGRAKQLVFYLLWDWFDGGFLEGWK
jgi:mono/diheme cytochrome c family protein